MQDNPWVYWVSMYVTFAAFPPTTSILINGKLSKASCLHNFFNKNMTRSFSWLPTFLQYQSKIFRVWTNCRGVYFVTVIVLICCGELRRKTPHNYIFLLIIVRNPLKVILLNSLIRYIRFMDVRRFLFLRFTQLFTILIGWPTVVSSVAGIYDFWNSDVIFYRQLLWVLCWELLRGSLHTIHWCKWQNFVYVTVPRQLLTIFLFSVATSTQKKSW